MPVTWDDGSSDASSSTNQQGTSQVKLFHSPARVFAAFDEPNLIAHAGLVPAVRLAERCGLPALVAEKVKLSGAKNGAGTAADAKVMSVVGGMVAGADSIDDLDVLRHGGLPKLFSGVRAPSTLGMFLRAFTWSHVRQLESAARAFACNLAAHTGFVPKGDEVVFVDIDSKVKQVYGPLHRLHQQEEAVPHHRPAHRPPRETTEPQDGA
ncbi:hypothetical protein AB0D14_37045 [Streptomyces sp. NPDC048484]|uniref:hypothetical protein n=1 Tax=Streptomyces sp. NPDC048484 TaxID=3155146 RepID=UPI003418E2B9